MMDRLIITNGDSAVAAIKHADIYGELLPWRDVLHEGPVPDGLNVDELARVRARYLATSGYGSEKEILRQLRDRDAILEQASQFREILLWFEHDLYDQLQLVQTLDRLSSDAQLLERTRIICRDEYVGSSSSADLQAAFDQRTSVTSAEVDHATGFWKEFRASTPNAWPQLTSKVEGGLRFLPSAMRRLIEELPDRQTGLSRSERQVLEAVSRNRLTPDEIFRFCQNLEQAPFMGDWSCWRIILRLQAADTITTDDGSVFQTDFRRRGFLREKFRMTPAGRQILAGNESLLDHMTLDRWVGGTHLTPVSVWFRTEDGEVRGPIDISKAE